MILQDLPTFKCSEQTSVPAAIFYSLQQIPWIHYFPVDTDIGQFLSLLLAFKNTKTRRYSEIKQTGPSTKQDFSGEALSKQNTDASLASLSCNLSRAMTEWSAILACGLLCGSRKYPYPHHGGNWKFRRGGGLYDRFTFQRFLDSIRI